MAEPAYHVDLFTAFLDTVYVAGWICHSTARLSALEVALADGVLFEVDAIGLASPDVAAVHGEHAERCRFWGSWTGPLPAGAMAAASLRGRFDDGGTLAIDQPSLQALRGDPVFQLTNRFQREIAATQGGALLEIGSRARSGITRRHLTPAGWRYTGVDILPGSNVDLVCDAHGLAAALPRESYDAFMCFSVFEHLLMPWKVALELNAVLRPGAYGIVTTHHAWPMHEQPWDFWRFSADAWQALFNPATGFEIVEACMGEPATLVADHRHGATDFPRGSKAFLSSAVLFRRTGRTSLSWPVDVGQVTQTMYPAATSGS